MEELQLKTRLEVFVNKYLKQIDKWHIASFDEVSANSPKVVDLVDYKSYRITFKTVRGEIFEVNMNKENINKMSVDDFDASLLVKLKREILKAFIEEV